MKSPLACAMVCVFLSACDDERRSAKGDDQQDDDCGLVSGAVVSDLEITDVAIYQGTRVPLMEGGEGVNGGEYSPVVAGKDAVMRIHLLRLDDWEPREVYARVDFEGGGESACPIEVPVEVLGDSTVADLGSTANVRIPGERIQPGVEYEVSIREADGDSGDDDGAAKWPTSGTASFDAMPTGGPLKIVIVPIKYDADGSGRLPELGDDQIQRFEDLFYATYPVSEVEIEVLEEMAWSQNVSAYGTGWDTLLNTVTQFRGQNGAANDEYYYGLFSPGDSFGAYCSGGCVTGLCNLVEEPSMSYGRACIGLGFSGEESAWTMVHEVGHAHGRYHSPSGGAQQTDPNYPYAGGVIGEYGYDLFNDSLKTPDGYYDFMGYAPSNRWVSDYTYEALFERVTAVNDMAHMVLPDDFEELWPTVSIGIDGRIARGPTLRLDAPPSGPRTEVLFEAADGTRLGSATGYYLRYDHFDAGLLLHPSPPREAAVLAIPGLGVLDL